MNIVNYNKKIHEVDLKRLLIHRNMSMSNLEKIPKHGILCYDEDNLVAAGFIRRMENNMGMLDSYITNSLFSSEKRHQALDLITENLINKAKKLKIKELMALTVHDTIIGRSLRFNFKPVNFNFSILKLT